MSILKVGSQVNEYKIIQELGVGPLGASYLGAHTLYEPTTGKPMTSNFTIKTINLAQLARQGADPNVLIENAKLLKQMSGNPVCEKYISCYYDYFVHVLSEKKDELPTQYLFIITDYIKGPSLQEIIREQIPKGNFEMPELLQMMLDIAEAVEYIHGYGLVHQNIKPSNIVYDISTKRLRLIDFAYSCSQSINKQCKGKVGTSYYMSPELHALPTDPTEQPFAFRAANDVWAMGVVFFQMANLGKNYIDFTSTDPNIIAKEIQLGTVKQSEYPYVPINSVIATILNKDYTQRPTAGQVVILLKLAQPLCKINQQDYDLSTVKAMVTSLGLDIDDNADAQVWCKTLTDYLNVCTIRNNKYQKDQLLKLAELLGIKVRKGIESAKLCDIIKSEITGRQKQYSQHVTELIINSLEYMATLGLRTGADPQLEPVLTKLEERYTFVYTQAKNLGLIDLQLLEDRRQEATRNSLVYAQNASIAYAKVYQTLAHSITQVIIDNNPNAEVGGVPLQDYHNQIFQLH